MKYKVYYSGFYYVEADSEEEALDTDKEICDVIYDEYSNDSVEEVDEFSIEL
jgi:hypothetical protein